MLQPAGLKSFTRNNNKNTNKNRLHTYMYYSCWWRNHV